MPPPGRPHLHMSAMLVSCRSASYRSASCIRAMSCTWDDASFLSSECLPSYSTRNCTRRTYGGFTLTATTTYHYSFYCYYCYYDKLYYYCCCSY